MDKAASHRLRSPNGQLYPRAGAFDVNKIALLGCGLLFGGGALINLYGAVFGATQSGALFHLFMTIFSFYLFCECKRHLKKTDSFGLFAPPFLASIVHFFLSYISPAAGSLFDPWILDRFSVFFWSQSDQLLHASLLIGVAAFCMWRGYGFTQRASAALRRRLEMSSYLRLSFDPQMAFVVALQFIYLALVVYAMSLGIFGFNNSPEMMEKYIQVRELLNIGISAGALSLFLIIVYVYKRRYLGFSEMGFYLFSLFLIFLNIIIGALSGFKSQIVFPFIVIVAAKFVAVRRISILGISMAVIALFFAYQVVEPFRAYLGRYQVAGASDIGSAISLMMEAQRQKDVLVTQDMPWGTQVISRFDLTGMTALGAALDWNESTVATMREQFAESLYLAIPNAIIPRALWPSKKLYSSGSWFANVAMGMPEGSTTSVAMGPVTWLYLLGGVMGVIVGFLAIGAVQALLFDGVGRAGAGGLIIYIAVVGTLVNIPTDVGPAFIGLLRLLPIAFCAQFFLLKRI